MKADIKKETDDGFGVSVYDNNGVEHKIGILHDGEKSGHLQDGYPDDPSERSMIDEVEPINQAVRYARYYVEQERGYDTVEWRQDPDRTLAAVEAVAALDSETFRQYFGDLYDQLRSHYQDIDRPVSLPDSAAPGHVNYQQDVYLGLDDGDLRALVEHGEAVGPEGLPENPDSVEDVAAELLETVTAGEAVTDRFGLEVRAVSGVHVRWDDATGQYHHQRGEHPDTDRNPDARIDLLPFNPESMDELQSHVVRNLVCQVRDCYVEMGVTPPEQFRIQGMGKHRTSTWYEHYDYYQRYHDPQADIEWDVES